MDTDIGQACSGKDTMVCSDNLGIRYHRAQEDVLSKVDLNFSLGDVVWVLGPNGSGKSSLGLAIAGMLPGIVPGYLNGHLNVMGHDPSSLSPSYRIDITGIIHQDPGTQLCTLTVKSELALILENKGIDPSEISHRVAKTLDIFGIKHLSNRDVLTLSGGEKQLVAIASLAVAPPAVLVLDEPCAYLDEENRVRVLNAIKDLKQDRPEITIILIEHRTDDLPSANKIIIVENGRITKFNAGYRTIPWGADLPTLVSLDIPAGKSPLLILENITFGYPDCPPILRHIDLSLDHGEIIVLRGINGSGKTTLLRLIAGSLRPQKGRIQLHTSKHAGGPILVPQNPEHLFITTTVREELKAADTAIILRFGLDTLMDRNPYTLSIGQKRRLSLAIAANHPGDLVLMDEPTYGLDMEGVRELIDLIGTLRRSGKGLLIVTHDTAFAKVIADRIFFLENGTIQEVLKSGKSDSHLSPSQSMHQIQSSILGSLNPLTRAAVSILFVVTASIITSKEILTAWLAIGLAALYLMTSLEFVSLLKRILPFAVIGIGFLWSNILFHKSGDLLAGFLNGVMLLLRALVFGTYSMIFIQDIDPEGFAHSLMRYLRASPKLIYATLIAFRLGPELKMERDIIGLALRLRGVKGRLERQSRVLFGVFISAFRRAGRITIALEGRGLNSGPRTYLSVPPFRFRDLFFLLVFLIVLIVPIALLGTDIWKGSYF